MSHFAQVKNGIVQQVIVAEQDFIDTLPDKEDWIQTSYNTHGGIHYASGTWNPDGGVALRANYAGIGDIYDAVNDVFYHQKPTDRNGLPCDSWTIFAPTWIWQPPVPCPFNTGTPENPIFYTWDEPTQTWIQE